MFRFASITVALAALLLVQGDVTALPSTPHGRAFWTHDLAPRDYKLGEWGKVSVVKDPQCVVACELLGHWVTHKDLTRRLMKEAEVPPYELIFSADAEAAARVVAAVEKHCLWLDKERGQEVGDWLRRDAQTAFLAGRCELRAEKMSALSDFLLVSSSGTPHLILLMDGQIQSCNVMLARDATGDTDLLFMGDDTNTGSFRTFERKK